MKEADFRQNKNNAEKFVSAGEYPLDKSIDTIQLAALMQVIHTIYNMDESCNQMLMQNELNKYRLNVSRRRFLAGARLGLGISGPGLITDTRVI